MGRTEDVSQEEKFLKLGALNKVMEIPTAPHRNQELKHNKQYMEQRVIIVLFIIVFSALSLY